MTYLRTVLHHLAKDLRLESRSRDALNGMLFFSLLVVVLFSISFDPTRAVSREITGGILWTAILFSTTTALNQSWTRELRHHSLDAQRLAPAPASALLLGKALANFLLVTILEVVLALIFIVFYNVNVLGNAWLLLLVLPLGTWSLVMNGTFFAALSLRTRSRELMLPLLLFPVSIPALLAMVQATQSILTADSDPTLWIKLLAGYCIVFTLVCLMLFSTVLAAE